MDATLAMSDRIDAIRRRIAAACAAAGRPSETVTLVAVAKTHPPEAVASAAACGIHVFGENRVQEAAAKIPLCPSYLDWHLVGHLQSNKVRPAVRLFSTLHAVDSIDLLRRIDAIAAEEGRRPRVLLEVNVSGEPSKFGLRPDDVPAAVAAANGLRHIELVGFMTMPPFTRDPADARPYFRALREWRDRIGGLTELSMGMSRDFEVAIEEGATMIRVGTDIFGPRGSPWKPGASEAFET